MEPLVILTEGGDGTDTVVLVGETDEASLSGVEVVVGSAGNSIGHYE